MTPEAFCDFILNGSTKLFTKTQHDIASSFYPRVKRHINMAFTLWTLFEATLLCLNAVCVLHEDRFLAKMGWSAQQNIQGFGEQPTIKSQLLNLVRSIRTVARFPLIFLNILTIIVKLVLG